MRSLFILLAILWSSPALAAFTTVGGSLAEDTTWGPDETIYVSATVALDSAVTLTVLPGTVIKGLDGTIMIHVTHADARLLVEGPNDFGDNMIIVTSCSDNDNGHGDDTSSANALCGASATEKEAGDFFRQTHGYVRAVGFRTYFLGSNSAQVYVTAESGVGNFKGTFIDNAVFMALMEPDVPTDYLLQGIEAVYGVGGVYSGNITIQNSFFYTGFGVLIGPCRSTGGVYGNITVSNVLVRKPDLAGWGFGLSSSDQDVATCGVYNSTVACDGATTPYGFYIDGVYSYRGHISNSSATGCDIGFWVFADEECPPNDPGDCATDYMPADHSYNHAAGNTTLDFSIAWRTGTGEGTNDPDFSAPDASHTPPVGLPSVFHNYHQGASSASLNDGSDTSRVFGSSAKHTEYTGVKDKGQVDVGFHYPSVVTVKGLIQ